MRVWERGREGGRERGTQRGRERDARPYVCTLILEALAGAENGEVLVWDIATSKCLYILNGHSGGVLSLDFSCGVGWLLASSAADGTLRLWDVIFYNNILFYVIFYPPPPLVYGHMYLFFSTGLCTHVVKWFMYT